jgi:hypothetical protein
MKNPISMAAVSGAVTTQQPLGRFEVFVGVSGNQGGVYHTWQLADQEGWQPSWQKYLPTPDENSHGLVAGRDGSGRIVVAWISNGDIHFAQAIHADASLSVSDDLTTIKPTVDRDDNKIYKFNYLVIAKNLDGKIEILALNERGRVFSIKQNQLIDDGNPWIGRSVGAPDLVGGGLLTSISVTHLKTGLALVGTGKDKKVYFKTQTDPGIWDKDNDNWINMGGDQIREARAQESTDNQLEVIALGDDKRIYLQYQNVDSTTLSGWQLLLEQTSSTKFGPSIFFDRFKDGSLFVVSHWDVDDSSQFRGVFGKAFQSPNNGSWPGTFFTYEAATIHDSGVDTKDDLGFLSPDAFTLVKDGSGDINYFACYRGVSKVEHYIDSFGASSQRSLKYQGKEHAMPDLP